MHLTSHTHTQTKLAGRYTARGCFHDRGTIVRFVPRRLRAGTDARRIGPRITDLVGPTRSNGFDFRR